MTKIKNLVLKKVKNYRGKSEKRVRKKTKRCTKKSKKSKEKRKKGKVPVVYVTDGMFDGTGPLALLCPFSVM